jgi:hypothetical protein
MNHASNIPAGTDIGKHNIVLIWCRDFSVSFGNAAEINIVEGEHIKKDWIYMKIESILWIALIM